MTSVTASKVALRSYWIAAIALLAFVIPAGGLILVGITLATQGRTQQKSSRALLLVGIIVTILQVAAYTLVFLNGVPSAVSDLHEVR